MIKVYWLYNEDNANIFRDGYIGVTGNQTRRFKKHAERFGKFKFKIIFYGNVEQALALEFILRPLPGIGWNEACGGANGYRANKSEAVKEKIRLSNLGLKRTEETKAKLKIIRTNISEETRQRMRIASTGRKLKPESKAKVIAALIGRKLSNETKLKIANSLKGVKHTIKRRKNIVNGKWNKYNLDMSNVMILKQ